MGRRKIEPTTNSIMYNDENLVRSNKLITAKYSSTLIENKLTAWAMKAATVDEKGRPSVSITTADIRELTGVKGNGIYDLLRNTSKKMIGRTIYFEDVDASGKKSFKYINMIHFCEYNDGKFTVTFTPECADMLYNLKGNFTSLNLKTLFSLSTNASYRLYEILSIWKYLIDEDNNPVPIVFPLSVLKLELNCIDTEESKVKKELMNPNPDYDKIVNELAFTNKFAAWSDFKKAVLNKAVKEVNEKTELFISYTPIRSGRGGKITAVKFFVQNNVGQKDTIFGDVIQQDTKVEKVMTNEEMERSKLINVVREILDGVKLSQKDIVSLLKVADNDIEKIRKAYDLSKKQSYIKNFMGWMTTAIKEEYDESIEVVEGDQNKASEAQELKSSVKKNEGDLAELGWQLVKQNENFQEFAEYILEVEGFNMDLFEIVHPNAIERNKIYAAWTKSRYN
ncbi:MAG: replication initiation protein [Eubacteriales bacterium]|nr:replication initiation protein [Eubacteriales bacterium]